MTAPETHYPPIAQALGRLRQPRPWPYAARPAETRLPDDAAPEAALPPNDFLRMLPEPALAGGPPAKKPAPTTERPALTAVEALALAPLNRTYWFDL